MPGTVSTWSRGYILCLDHSENTSGSCCQWRETEEGWGRVNRCLPCELCKAGRRQAYIQGGSCTNFGLAVMLWCLALALTDTSPAISSGQGSQTHSGHGSNRRGRPGGTSRVRSKRRQVRCYRIFARSGGLFAFSCDTPDFYMLSGKA